MIKPFCIQYKPTKTEEWEKKHFQLDVNDTGMIFIYGGGMECCISKRVAQLMFNQLKKRGIVK